MHFIDSDTGGLPDFTKTKYRYELQASTVDHALLQAGAMTAASYFGGEVAKLADEIVADANWRAMYDEKAGFLTMGWRAIDRSRRRWTGRNPAELLAMVQR